MSILSVWNGDRGNVLNTGSHKHKVKCRHQSEDQSHRSFANQRIIITDFLAKPSQQLNMKGLVALSCALSLSYHHLFPSLHYISFALCVPFLSVDPNRTVLHPIPPCTLLCVECCTFVKRLALFGERVQANKK